VLLCDNSNSMLLHIFYLVALYFLLTVINLGLITCLLLFKVVKLKARVKHNSSAISRCKIGALVVSSYLKMAEVNSYFILRS
jgi:hypothetical protein